MHSKICPQAARMNQESDCNTAMEVISLGGHLRQDRRRISPDRQSKRSVIPRAESMTESVIEDIYACIGCLRLMILPGSEIDLAHHVMSFQASRIPNNDRSFVTGIFDKDGLARSSGLGTQCRCATFSVVCFVAFGASARVGV
jgi:hypothetical protein